MGQIISKAAPYAGRDRLDMVIRKIEGVEDEDPYLADIRIYAWALYRLRRSACDSDFANYAVRRFHGKDMLYVADLNHEVVRESAILCDLRGTYGERFDNMPLAGTHFNPQDYTYMWALVCNAFKQPALMFLNIERGRYPWSAFYYPELRAVATVADVDSLYGESAFHTQGTQSLHDHAERLYNEYGVGAW